MKYGLIGERLGHSFSKTIHEKIADYTYELKEIPPEALDDFMTKRDFRCINVTIPYKSAVIPYLYYIDPTAEKIGAVNTVVNRDGRLYGYNTDFGGMKMLVEKNGFDFKDKKLLILGTGGTSKTAEALCEALSAGEIITVARETSPLYRGVSYSNAGELHGDADYIINTTPVGMYPHCDACPIEVSEFSRLKGVIDAVYNPLRTRLCQKAHSLGIKADCGLYMLVCQAVLACEIFTGRTMDVRKISDEIYSEILAEKQNIVLVGMPGSGKSTIGKALSEMTGREFIDTDSMITAEYGNISEIFKNHGEEYFRDIEESCVRAASDYSGVIIATGGGAILRQRNIDNLRQNGVIFFLNRPIEDIVPTADRPLSSDTEALTQRFLERYDKYVAASDKEIFIDGNVSFTAEKILECMQ